jgi:DNA-binding NtrC family response regulator
MVSELLIVDDDPAVTFPMRRYFSLRSYGVACAATVEEAERLLVSRRFSTVITDLRLSGVDSAEGLDVVRFAREWAPESTIVVMTAYGTPEMEAEARRLGADAVVRKPIALAEVARLAAPAAGRGSLAWQISSERQIPT